MSLAVVASQSGVTSSLKATSAAMDTTGADLIVAAIAYYGQSFGGGSNGPVLLASFSDSKSNTWTALLTDHRAASGPNQYCGCIMAYIKNPTSVGSSHTFTFNQGAEGANYPAIAVIALSGSNLTTPLNVQNGSAPTATSTIVSPGTITANASDIAITAIQIAETFSGVTIPSGFTYAPNTGQDIVGGQSFGIKMAYLLNCGTVTTPTWVGTSDIRSTAIASWVAAASAIPRNRLPLLGANRQKPFPNAFKDRLFREQMDHAHILGKAA